MVEHLSLIINVITLDQPMWMGINQKTNFIEISHGRLVLADGITCILYPEFDYETAAILGLPKTLPNDADNPPTVIGTPASYYNFGQEQLFIYSDIIDPIHVESKEKPIFNYFTVPPGLRYGQNLTIRFSQRDQRRLKVTDLQDISIDIKNKHGKIPSFEYGDTFVTLHFHRDAY